MRIIDPVIAHRYDRLLSISTVTAVNTARLNYCSQNGTKYAEYK